MQIKSLEAYLLLWNFFPVRDLLSPEHPGGIFPHATCDNSYQSWVTYNCTVPAGWFLTATQSGVLLL